jgi:DNA-binding response OmpR family regulator
MDSGKILIIEADQFTRDVYREALIGEGYAVDTAEDGVVGMKLIKQ